MHIGSLQATASQQRETTAFTPTLATRKLKYSMIIS
uniref:Uncharacterized protein n=1 Tax=Arundo donax TaxID=35708 RepID=A0A0A9P5P9_ARUDO